MRNIMWTFQTKNFRIVASVEPSDWVDTSFDDTGETAAKIDSGEWTAFDTVVTVYHHGRDIGHDSLCESIYAEPREFFTAHRDADPMARNCSIMRASRGGNVCICHYFPDMVRQAIADARSTLADMQTVRLRA